MRGRCAHRSSCRRRVSPPAAGDACRDRQARAPAPTYLRRGWRGVRAERRLGCGGGGGCRCFFFSSARRLAEQRSLHVAVHVQRVAAAPRGARVGGHRGEGRKPRSRPNACRRDTHARPPRAALRCAALRCDATRRASRPPGDVGRAPRRAPGSCAHRARSSGR
eukprot:scaffold1324_cov204-Prasinococcus_capsulatus_cf.AAC.1